MDVMTAYEQWLKDFAADADTIADLKAIADDPKEIEDRFYTELSFGTAGMRGVLGAGMNRMNIYTVRRATQGLADYLIEDDVQNKERGVVIGYDSRRMSTEFALETALVLCANGIKTYLFDALRPVALLSFGVRHLNAKAGVVITASHNPPQYNGYKVYGEDGAQLGPEAAEAVTGKIYALKFTDAKLMTEEEAKAAGLLHIIGDAEVDDEYIARVKTLSINPVVVAEAGKNLKIAMSPDFMYFETISETDPCGYEGLDIDIIKSLSDKLGFEWEIVPMSFSSLIGSLQTGNADSVLLGECG